MLDRVLGSAQYHGGRIGIEGLQPEPFDLLHLLGV